ncbi:ketoacyl-ACP synthase III family protein [Actinomadura harenae]|uniref:3-oxoacyl-ACP synthase n=1 Tax=Actinomadura harenae TaxID=2483351 RepID=A0A3M2M0Z2_9ACTN|nr:ketoacyl-ACP synthase III family protein [Actinomadura harenae]RMI43186.1 3-oxoacyl-ACP synthase [Actinomadura harenae]
MRTPDIFVNAVGTFLPELRPAPSADDDTMTGAAVGGDLPAVEMALNASRQALERSGASPDSFDTLLYVEVYHSGPDGWYPHAYLQRHLLGGDMLAATIGQGCNGVFGALELAAGRLGALGGDRSAMIVAADNLDSPLLDRWTALTGYCMGDGATALVLSTVPGFARLRSVTSSTVTELEELHRGKEPLHPSGLVTGQPTDFQARSDAFIGGGGFTDDLILKLIRTTEEVVTRALDEAGIGMEQVTRVAPFHGPWSNLEVYLSPLGLTRDRTTWEYGRAVGHSACDHLLGFDHLLSTGGLRPGDHLLMFGVGPGVNLAAAVIEIVDGAPWR